MSIAKTLMRARDLIADKSRWTQHQYARTKEGNPAFFFASNAHAYCASGAIKRVANVCKGDMANSTGTVKVGAFVYPFTGEEIAAVQFLEEELGSLIVFNDLHSHREVIAAFNRAIKRASAPFPPPERAGVKEMK